MFTGLITDIGEITAVSGSDSRQLKIKTSYPLEMLPIGASIACSGICLTVTHAGIENGASFFTIDASPHTIAHTTLGEWSHGTRINLEASLKVGQELGGHIVSGHVDGIAMITKKEIVADAVNYTVTCNREFLPYIATKGSVTLDGTSLTVTWAEEDLFGLTLIPHTLAVTTWSERKEGDRLNLEVDLIARYVERMLESR
ncbi:MAG: riboflavin synthase [Rickettsiales bacterium]